MSQYCRVNLSISPDMVSAYIDEVLASTSVNLSKGEIGSESPEEGESLIDLLYDYAERKGVDIDSFVDPNGIDPNKMGYKTGVDEDSAKRVAIGYGYGNGYVGCVMAIPPEVAGKIWGRGIYTTLYIVIVEDKNEVVEPTDPSKIRIGPNGKPVPQYRRKIVVGGYNILDAQDFSRVVSAIGGTASRAMQNFWRKAIADRLAKARANPKSLEQMLMAASKRQNAANTDKIDVSKVQNTTVTFQQTNDQNCDFVAIVTCQYVWQPKRKGEAQQNLDVRATPETDQGHNDQRGRAIY